MGVGSSGAMVSCLGGDEGRTPADILTKSLERVKFWEMRERLGVVMVCMEELSQGGEY